MTRRTLLIAMTAVAVISDSMLHPFFPQYFATVLGVDDPRHVGAYIAACSLVVLVAFPVWARIARRVVLVRLLIATQLAAAVLSVACGMTSQLVPFWTLSLAMLACKASYLLIYPHILSLERKDAHLATISLLAFVLYFGRIVAALLSGMVFQLVAPHWLFVVMACGDVVQTALCAVALRAAPPAPARDAAPAAPSPAPRAPGFVYRLGAVMLLLYGSAYLTQPFFSQYWAAVVATDNKILAGAVFAIPGLAALGALYTNARARRQAAATRGIASAIALAAAGLAVQLTGVAVVVAAGRGLFGWALFQSMVRLDAVMFRLSTPASYAIDFSKINLFQGAGVLIASYAAGAIAGAFDARVAFVIAAAGLVATIALYRGLLPAVPRRAARATSLDAGDRAAAQEIA